MVRVLSDVGLVGLGEACPGFEYTGETLDTVARAIRDRLAPVVVGRDPLHIEDIVHRWDGLGVGDEAARGALEMALWDLKGKALGRPLCGLIGGRRRAFLPETWPLDRREAIDSAVSRARAVFEQGVRVFKVYLCPSDEGKLDDRGEDLVAALRDAVGSACEIRVDANGGWATARRAVAAIRRLERCSVAFVEEPVRRFDYRALRQIRACVDTPVCLDESVRGTSEVLAAVRAGACDLINVKLMKSGGILAALAMNAVAEAAGVRVHIGNMGHSSVGTAAAAHLHAAVGNAVSSDTDLPLRGGDFARDIARGLAYEVHGGLSVVPVPMTAGLGVTLDDEAVTALSGPPG